ncbi:ribonuclease H-like domain-containing protein [Xylariaceae sp. FL0255]|nr:ribonuclease H-like domain-containing protein [Xylariaceae sp. FL0255]
MGKDSPSSSPKKESRSRSNTQSRGEMSEEKKKREKEKHEETEAGNGERQKVESGKGESKKKPLKREFRPTREGKKNDRRLFGMNYPEELFRHTFTVDPPEKDWEKVHRIMQIYLDTFNPTDEAVATDFETTILAGRRLEDKFVTDRDERYAIKVNFEGMLTMENVIQYLMYPRSPSHRLQKPGKLQITQYLGLTFSSKMNFGGDGDFICRGVGGLFSKFQRVQDSKNQHTNQGEGVIIPGILFQMDAANPYLYDVIAVQTIYVEPMALDKIVEKYAIPLDKLEAYAKGLGRMHITHREPDFKIVRGLATKNDGEKERNPPRVNGLLPHQVEFWWRGFDCYISVFDYFKDMYPSVNINKKYPLVNVGRKKRPTYLPLEVCSAAPYPPGEEQVVDKYERIFKRTDHLGPARRDKIEVSLRIRAKATPIPADARRSLQPPKISYKEGQKEVRNGSWKMSDQKFSATSTKSVNWLCISIGTKHQQANMIDLEGIMTELNEKLEEMGIKVGKSKKIQEDVEIGHKADDHLKMVLSNAVEKGYEFALVILPSKGRDFYYSRVKNIADRKCGIHTVCCTQKACKDRSYLNVAMKINLKFGGKNQLVESYDTSSFLDNQTMVVGIDVTNLPPKEPDILSSIVAMVANIDKDLSHWPGTARLQEKKKPMGKKTKGTTRYTTEGTVSSIQAMLESRLILWAEKHHKAYPKKILIYQSGVPEEEFHRLMNEDIQFLMNACGKLYPQGGMPLITLVAVNKGRKDLSQQHDTAVGEKYGPSLPSGMFVDGDGKVRHLVGQDRWDFRLSSHLSVNGATCPAHYAVLLDEIFRLRKDADHQLDIKQELEKVTNHLCFVSGRATQSTSVCAPVYYADLLARRSRLYLTKHDDPKQNVYTECSDDALEIHKTLKDSMFYI